MGQCVTNLLNNQVLSCGGGQCKQPTLYPNPVNLELFTYGNYFHIRIILGYCTKYMYNTCSDVFLKSVAFINTYMYTMSTVNPLLEDLFLVMVDCLCNLGVGLAFFICLGNQ